MLESATSIPNAIASSVEIDDEVTQKNCRIVDMPLGLFWWSRYLLFVPAKMVNNNNKMKIRFQLELSGRTAGRRSRISAVKFPSLPALRIANHSLIRVMVTVPGGTQRNVRAGELQAQGSWWPCPPLGSHGSARPGDPGRAGPGDCRGLEGSLLSWR